MSQTCLICGSPAKRGERGDEVRESIICKFCGVYRPGDFILGILSATHQEGEYNLSKLKSALFYYLRVVKKNHLNTRFQPYIIILNEIERFSRETYIRIDDVYKIYPDNFNKKIDMVMELLYSQINDIGESLYVPKNDQPFQWIDMLFMPSDNNMRARNKLDTLRLLEEIGYIVKTNEVATAYTFSFTSKGWEKIDSLQRGSGNTAFIAMSFNFSNPIIKLAEECIRKAISEAGYVPQIISEKEHNNFIMDEILYEIKQAAFVVADLTEQKTGVYYEAGYAKALGKEVILTCHGSDFGNRHFDIAQVNTIKWDKEEDFVNDLKRRIQITVGYNK